MSWLFRWLGRGGSEPASLPSSIDRMADARSRDGHVREAAVRALGVAGHGPALPLLLERVNDWVPQVREAAREAVAAFLHTEHLGAWAPALDALGALQRGSRADHAALLRDIAAFLLEPEHVAALKAAGAAMTRASARILLSFELGHASDEATHFRLLRDAATSDDVVMAATAMARLDSLPSPSHRIGLAGAACVSPFASIRASGLRAALRTGDASVASLVRALSTDDSASVRAIALAALGDDRERVLDGARRTLREGRTAKQRAVALSIVCALDGEAAVAICEAVRSDRAAAVRRVAVAHLFTRSRGDGRDALVVAALADESPRLRDLAVAQVGKGAFAPPTDVLRRFVAARPDALGHAIRIAAHGSPWARLAFPLEAASTAAHGSPSWHLVVAELERMDRDLVRAFVRPSAAQEHALALAWRLAQDRLPVPLRRLLASHLEASGLASGAP